MTPTPGKAAPLPYDHELFEDGIMTPAEVCRLFQVTSRTVTSWADSGRLAYFRTVGGHRRFSESQVLRVLNGTDQAWQEELERRRAGATERLAAGREVLKEQRAQDGA